MARIGLLQMVSSTKIADNLLLVEECMQQAQNESVDLLVLPENFAYMGRLDTDKLKIAEPYKSGPIQKKISQLAKKYRLWVVAGTIPLQDRASKTRASSLVFDDNGLLVARYDKIHLFDVRVSSHEAHEESATIAPGNACVVVPTPVGNIGLTVCYDLRFPELYQELTRRGAELFTVPSAFTAVTGQAHWDVLLRARAIENLCYVLAPNQGGHHESNRHTFGHSMVIEPWGGVIAKKESGIGLITADIDLERLHQLRHQFPCNNHHVLKI